MTYPPDVSPGRDRSAVPPRSAEWRRAAALFLLVLAISTVPSVVLVGVPFVLLTLVLPARRFGGLVLAAFVAFVVTAGSGSMGGLWYAERGWAVLVGGWFVAATLRWPDRGTSVRALVAVAGAGLTALLFFVVSPGAWSVIDFAVRERLASTVTATIEALRVLRGEAAIAPTLVQAVRLTAEWQHELFPGLLALASMGALALAWWIYLRAGLGLTGALKDLRDFRFNDHLVWVFVAGLALILAGLGEVWTRMGSNAVLFMAGLYALRGVAVVLFINGGISLIGGVAIALAMVFLAPVLVAGALLIGLGDTWLDLRARMARSA